MDKVGHTVLQRGQIIRSPSGDKDWIVVETADQNELVKIACIQKYMNKNSKELMEWLKK